MTKLKASEDITFSRSLLRLTLNEVRKDHPCIKTGDASFIVCGPNEWGHRWMEFEFEGSKTQGYFSSRSEGLAKGWQDWLDKQASES